MAYRFFKFKYLVLFLLCSCSSIPQKQNLAVSRGVYSTQVAIKAGRIDLAESYIEQTSRLLPPPKEKISIRPVISHDKEFVILPKQFNGLTTVAFDSPAFTLAVGQDKALQGQLRAEKVALENFTKGTEDILRDKEAQAGKYDAQKPTIWQGIKNWGKWLSMPVLLIGGVVLCVLFPAIIPLLQAAVSLLVSVASGLISWIAGKIK